MAFVNTNKLFHISIHLFTPIKSHCSLMSIFYKAAFFSFFVDCFASALDNIFLNNNKLLTKHMYLRSAVRPDFMHFERIHLRLRPRSAKHIPLLFDVPAIIILIKEMLSQMPSTDKWSKNVSH